jgi:hypothetical protein
MYFSPIDNVLRKSLNPCILIHGLVRQGVEGWWGVAISGGNDGGERRRGAFIPGKGCGEPEGVTVSGTRWWCKVTARGGGEASLHSDGS